MASAGQQLKERKYSYGYDDYSALLNDVHSALETKMKSFQNQKNAQELQQILMEIKEVSNSLGNSSLSIVSEDLKEEYEDFINEIAATQGSIRKSQGLSGGKGKRIFNRRSNENSFARKQVTKGADDILEETFAVMEAVLQKRLSGKDYKIGVSNVQGFLAGQIAGDSSATRAFANDITEGMTDGLRQSLEKVVGHAIKTQHLKVDKSQKTDALGFNKEFVASLSLDTQSSKLAKLAELLADATFTMKNYSSWTTKSGERQKINYKSLDLHLGNTNLFKVVTGAIDRTITRQVIDQRDIYYRGLQILVRAYHPSATPEEIATHFNHMRFMFELSGYGLTDKDGNPLFAKYLIYNDSAGDAIYVKDTATLILEEFEKDASASRLFSEIGLSAARVNSAE